MNYIGTWVFHSIATMNDKDEMVFLSAEEYMKAPMPYVDETDEEAVADELRERKRMVGTHLKVCTDGKLYMLSPLPEGVPQEEVDKAVAAGIITLVDGIEGELFGEKTDSWVKAIDDEGFFIFATTRFVKA